MLLTDKRYANMLSPCAVQFQSQKVMRCEKNSFTEMIILFLVGKDLADIILSLMGHKNIIIQWRTEERRSQNNSKTLNPKRTFVVY